MAKNPRKAFVAAKIETTKGTPVALAAADAAILAYEPDVAADIQISERAPAGICSGTLPGQPGLYQANVRLRCELRGSGTADALPVWAATLLQASALNPTVDAGNSVTLAPVTSIDDQDTVTVAVWMDGLKHVAAGCMFNARISGRPGEAVFVEFEGRGIHITPIDEAAPTGITHESTRPIRLAGIAATLGGVAKTRLNQLEIDLGNDIQLRPDTANASGLAHAYLADRRPTMTLDPEAVSVATDDVYGDLLTGQTKAVALTLGTTAGNRVLFGAPAFSHENPASENAQGLLRHRLPGRLNTLTGADDHYTLTFN